MFKTLMVTALLITGVTLSNCSDEMASPEKRNVRELTGLEKRLVESDNRFGFKLFKEICDAQQDKNVFISPLSVSMALGMTLNGAKGNTEQAMKTTLELSDLSKQQMNESYKSLIELLQDLDENVIFEIANSIWYRQELIFEQPFIDLNKTYFNAEVRGLNFGSSRAPNTINQWVDDKTHGKIKKIVDQISPEMVMYLINAIYFKGSWAHEFDENQTQDDWFTRADSSRIPCKMMQQKHNFSYFESDDFQAIDLPYSLGDFSMTVFLPKPGENVDELIAKINHDNWNQWLTSFYSHEVNLEFPKFKLEYEFTLNEVLKALGMEIAFDQNRADFTGMYQGTERCYISEVKHKTFVDVNEEGTEAAAVTSVGIGITSVISSPIVMRVDRPFVFVIRENRSQTILFIGKIMEPKVN